MYPFWKRINRMRSAQKESEKRLERSRWQKNWWKQRSSFACSRQIWKNNFHTKQIKISKIPRRKKSERFAGKRRVILRHLKNNSKRVHHGWVVTKIYYNNEFRRPRLTRMGCRNKMFNHIGYSFKERLFSLFNQCSFRVDGKKHSIVFDVYLKTGPKKKRVA